MKFGIKIMPREVILDTQGRAVEQTLKRRDFNLDSCRVGKYVEIEVATQDEAKGRDEVKRMTEFVLFNPLIETYEIQRIGG